MIYDDADSAAKIAALQGALEETTRQSQHWKQLAQGRDATEGANWHADFQVRCRALGSATPQPTPDAMRALDLLIKFAYAAWNAIDNSEQRDDGDEFMIVDRHFGQPAHEALDALDDLPDDQPGYIMGPIAKVQWALRSLTDSSAPVPSPDGAGEMARSVLRDRPSRPGEKRRFGPVNEVGTGAAEPVKPRRLLDDDEPNGYLESDDDWIANNREAVIRFLEAGVATHPVRGDREAIEFLISTRANVYSQQGGKLFGGFTVAEDFHSLAADILSLPVQPGADGREAWKEIGEAWAVLQNSGFPPEASGWPFESIEGKLPDAIDAALDCLIQQREDLLIEVKELRASRQPPQSNREG